MSQFPQWVQIAMWSAFALCWLIIAAAAITGAIVGAILTEVLKRAAELRAEYLFYRKIKEVGTQKEPFQ